jgi:hypothetical protein
MGQPVYFGAWGLSAWYASAMYFPIAIVLGLALWSFRTTLSGRRPLRLKDNLFDV